MSWALLFHNTDIVSKKLTIVAATFNEIQPLQEYLQREAVRHSSTHFQLGDIEIDILISGVGLLHATYSLMEYLTDHKPDAWIQIGIGGAFDTSLEMEQVYLIESETLVDFGAQDKDGSIINQFQLGWMTPDEYPYSDEKLQCPYLPMQTVIPVASGMTTVHSHGFVENIEKISEGLHGQIENMEGAGFFYVSLMKQIPFWSFRSISNYVESRNKDRWKIDTAIKNLNEKIIWVLNDKLLIEQLFV